MQQIIVKLTLGEDVEPLNEYESKFIERSKLDIAEIKNLGGEVSIPNEWP